MSASRPGRAGTRLFLVAVLALVAFVVLLPVLWWISFALSDNASHEPGGSLVDVWLPDGFHLIENVRTALELYPFDRFFVNSLIVAAVVTVADVFLAALAGYAFAKLEFPGRTALFALVISLLMVPQIVVVVPLFELAVDLGLTNSYWILVLPFLVSPLGVFLMRQFMLSIPDAYIESARSEGAGEFRIFATIALPLARNALLTLAIFTFLLQWDSLLWPLIAVNEQSYLTLPVGISLLQTNVQVPYNAIYAITLVVSVPMIVLYIIFQRQFMRSMAFVGIRG
jgi:multiple sugar transport system permease protein